jgi:tetrahydromethanopterin S-methyltransferase subunit C
LWIWISAPKEVPVCLNSAITGAPAVLRVGSKGRGASVPVIFVMTIPGVRVTCTVTASPGPSRAKPMISNPDATFETDAGANAVAESMTHLSVLVEPL